MTATATRDLIRDIHDLTDEEIAQAMDHWAHLSELIVPLRKGERAAPEAGSEDGTAPPARAERLRGSG